MNSASGIPVSEQPLARVLIIEDEPMIAENIRAGLEDAGFAIAGIAGKLEKALRLIETAVFDAAIIDANLAGVSAGPAATSLVARALPFIVLSGYSELQLSDVFAQGLFIQKPYRIAQLVDGLKIILIK